MSLNETITTLFFVRVRNTNVTRINRRSLRTFDTHEITQLHVRRRVTIVNKSERRRSNIAKFHDENIKKTKNKLIVNEDFA